MDNKKWISVFNRNLQSRREVKVPARLDNSPSYNIKTCISTILFTKTQRQNISKLKNKLESKIG